jgi:hypothetical protein
LKAFITKQSGLLAWQVWKDFLHGLYAQHNDFNKGNFDLFMDDRRRNFHNASRYYWFDQVRFIHGTMMAGQGMIRITLPNGPSFIIPDPELVAGDSFAKPTSMTARPAGCAVVNDAIASINRKAKELLLSPEEQEKLREQKKLSREQREQERQQEKQQQQQQQQQQQHQQYLQLLEQLRQDQRLEQQREQERQQQGPPPPLLLRRPMAVLQLRTPGAGGARHF